MHSVIHVSSVYVTDSPLTGREDLWLAVKVKGCGDTLASQINSDYCDNIGDITSGDEENCK